MPHLAAEKELFMNGNLDLGFLRTLTENPEFMQKAISMASALSSSGIFSQAFEGSSQKSDARQERVDKGAFSFSESDTPSPSGSGNLGDVLSLLSGAAGGSQPKAQQNQSEAKESGENKKADHKDRIRLLEAMRPFVPPERRDKLDFIIKLLGLMQIANQLGLKNILEGR